MPHHTTPIAHSIPAPTYIDSLVPTIQPQHTQHSYPQHTTHLALGHGYSLSHLGQSQLYRPTHHSPPALGLRTSPYLIRPIAPIRPIRPIAPIPLH